MASNFLLLKISSSGVNVHAPALVPLYEYVHKQFSQDVHSTMFINSVICSQARKYCAWEHTSIYKLTIKASSTCIVFYLDLCHADL